MRLDQVAMAFLVMALTATAVAQELLGRLLTTPQERRLIADRHQLLETGADTKQPQERIVRFDGVVKRDDGRLEIWVDGRLITETEQLHSLGVVQVLQGEDPQLVILTVDGAVYRLCPGQAFDRQRKQVLESWQVSSVWLAGPVENDTVVSTETEK